MDIKLMIEPWRKSMNLPELPHEHFEKLIGSKRMKEFLMHMTQRIAQLERKAFAQSAWIYKKMSDRKSVGKGKEVPIGKLITNARRRQLLVERINDKYREISSSEKEARDLNLEIKNLSEKIQNLSQSIKERAKKTDLVMLYYKELLKKQEDTSCFLNYVKETQKMLERTRDIKGLLASFPEKMELKKTLEECLENVCNVMNHLEQARLCGFPEYTLCQMAESKHELIHFLRNKVNQYPWSYILQHVLSRQDGINSKINELVVDWLRFKSKALLDKENEFDDPFKLHGAYTIKWHLTEKEDTWENHFLMIKEKLEDVHSVHQEAKAEVKELLATAHHKMQSHNKKIIMALKSIPRSIEKFHAAYRRNAELDLGHKMLIVSIENLNSFASRELKMFVDTPLICLEKSTLSDEKIDSYRNLSHFNQIPRDVINVCGWTIVVEDSLFEPLHMLAKNVLFQVQYLKPMRHTVQILLECAPLPFEGFDEQPERKKFNHEEMGQKHSSFAHTMIQLEQVFYDLLKLHKFHWEHCQAEFIPPDLTVAGKTAEEWQHFFKLYFK